MLKYFVHRVHSHVCLTGCVRAALSIWQYAYRESTETRFFGDVFILRLLGLWSFCLRRFNDWRIETGIRRFSVAAVTAVVAIATTGCQCHSGSQQAQVSH